MMRRLTVNVAAAAAVALALTMLAAPALAGTEALIQGVDTSAYPQVSFTIIVPPGLSLARGELPPVVVTENGDTIADSSITSLEEDRRPIDVVLLIDTSGSMKGSPLADARAAARRFVGSMGPADRIAIVSVSSQPSVLLEFTSDRAQLGRVIDALTAGGETALYDGLVQSAKIARASTSTERYVVALSDGGDTMSIGSADTAARALKVAGTPVYAVALESPEYRPATLESIARASGGKMVSAGDSASLVSIYQSIAEEMQLRYRVEYLSTRPNTPELDILVDVGEGESALQARTTATNPLFEQAGGADRARLKPATPSGTALAASLAGVFLGVSMLTFAVGLIFRRDHAAIEQLRYYDQLHADATTEFTSGDPATSRSRLVEALGSVAESRGFTGLVQSRLASAGLPLRANEYIILHLLLTVAAGLLAHLLFGGVWLLTLAVVSAAVIAPMALVTAKSAQRRRKLEEQLPGILNLIAGSLRSGWGVQQAIDLVVDEVGDPARAEFRRVQNEARLGLPLESALHRMAERVDSEDLRWTVSAIAIQREVGGNLAEVLDAVARTIRERAELRRSVAALTAEGRFSALVLTVLPFAVFVMLAMVSRDYVTLLITTRVGLIALTAGIVLLLVGTVWMNRVTKVEV